MAVILIISSIILQVISDFFNHIKFRSYSGVIRDNKKAKVTSNEKEIWKRTMNAQEIGCFEFDQTLHTTSTLIAIVRQTIPYVRKTHFRMCFSYFTYVPFGFILHSKKKLLTGPLNIRPRWRICPCLGTKHPWAFLTFHQGPVPLSHSFSHQYLYMVLKAANSLYIFADTKTLDTLEWRIEQTEKVVGNLTFVP